MFTVAIISQKGGAGKTTLALHLAAAATAAKRVALVIDADPQATASTWAGWRQEEPPEVIDCASPPLLAKKLQQAAGLGVDLAVIDTPPHAELMAREACKAADLLLIPCRPLAFDLAAIQTTAELAKASGKPAFVVFTAGAPRAPAQYAEAAEVVAQIGLTVAPVMLPQRAAFAHAVAEGKTAPEIDPTGKAADEVAALWSWVQQTAGIKPRRSKKDAAE